MTTQSSGASQRASSLDAFRGYAILTMVLSGAIVYGILPGWMYHAQVPPPLHKFDPSILGITWVDLVFPFFLFAMGAAFPFSIGKKLSDKGGVYKAILNALIRGCQLTFFAIYIQHLYPWIISDPPDLNAWLITLFAFALMFPMFMRLPDKYSPLIRNAVKLGAYAIGVVLLLTLNYANNRTFSLGFSNIIILVLANMAIFGSLAYIFTAKNRLARMAILPFIMAVFLGSTTEGSWTQWLFNFSPVPWMYKFYYLKYLFIIIPGTIAGEYLADWLKTTSLVKANQKYSEKSLAWQMLILSAVLIISNLFFLYTRLLVLNLLFTSILLTGGFLMLRKVKTLNVLLWRNLFVAGAYLLMLGLFFEAFEGGIRKDHSTYSYYFVTSGLAFMVLIFFSIACDFFEWNKYSRFLVMSGQNPMIAYVSSSMLIMPLLNITGVASYLSVFDSNPWLGFLKGVIITALVALVAMFFTRIKWYWRT